MQTGACSSYLKPLSINPPLQPSFPNFLEQSTSCCSERDTNLPVAMAQAPSNAPVVLKAQPQIKHKKTQQTGTLEGQPRFGLEGILAEFSCPFNMLLIKTRKLPTCYPFDRERGLQLGVVQNAYVSSRHGTRSALLLVLHGCHRLAPPIHRLWQRRVAHLVDATTWHVAPD